MLRRFFKGEDTEALDRQIASVLFKMKQIGVSHEDYTAQLALLERLYELKLGTKPEPVSRDTLASGAFTLLGILIIVVYEQKHVWASKALTQLPRIR